MKRRMILVAIGLVAASWWTGFDIVRAKDSFVRAIEDTGGHLAGGDREGPAFGSPTLP